MANKGFKGVRMKKMTVIRQMSFGQYIQARWALENPEQYKAGLMLDISIYKQEQLDINILMI